jgi:hypothetical protein
MCGSLLFYLRPERIGRLVAEGLLFIKKDQNAEGSGFRLSLIDPYKPDT